MQPSTRRAVLIAVLGLAVAAGLAWSFRPRAVPVETATVTRGPMSVEVSDDGRTRIREIYRLSAPVSGTLLRVDVHPGDVVVGGRTKVAELLPTTPGFLDVRTHAQAAAAVEAAEAARTLAAAEVKRARAQLDFADADSRRATALSGSNAISRADLERAELARDTAAAALASAEAALKVKQSDLAAAKALLIDPTSGAGTQPASHGIPLVAPVSGSVLRVQDESETVLAAGTPILDIGDPHTIEIVAELISEDAVRVRAGDPARITDWGGPAPLDARVRRVEPSAFTKVSALGVEEQRVNVLLDPAGPNGAWNSLADGYRVVVHITVWKTADALRVPVAALFRAGNGWAAFVLRDGRAARTTVSVGHQNDDIAEVLAGLKAGDRVVVHPGDTVRDGVRVTVAAGGD
jgi:HlyD family secretion protein